ncbi:MAG: VTC domain-containing protein, partial [Bacteroidales bacterium]|nr:VTC domain-containing protein [Bacteroidales bacterium]
VDSGLSFLEVKTKNNHRRTRKRRITINDFDPTRPRYDISFTPGSPDDALFGDFLTDNLRFDKASVSEQLENRFSRITLVNRKKTERLTIDSALVFRNLRTGNTRKLDDLVIIELKRDGLTESPVLEILRQLRIHPMGFSKYCMGTAMTDPGIKQNRFKSRIRDVEKILL